MRYYIASLFCALTIVGYSQTAKSDSEEAPRAVPHALIKISPFQFFVQTFELSLEAFNASYSKSFQISAGYKSGDNDFTNGSGATVTLAYRKYARTMDRPLIKNPDVRQGIYYSLYLKGDTFNGTEAYFSQPIGKTSIMSISPGFTLGVQRTMFDVMFVDFYVGGGIKFPSIDYTGSTHPDQGEYDIFSPGYEGIYPMIGIKVGIGL
jgi:hypothetical protein